MKSLESMQNEKFGEFRSLKLTELNAIRGGATTKTKGLKTKESAGDNDSAAQQENPHQSAMVESTLGIDSNI